MRILSFGRTLYKYQLDQGGAGVVELCCLLADFLSSCSDTGVLFLSLCSGVVDD
jgi:hypothetical protein